MKPEQPNRPLPSDLFPTAGYGSVAPTWIKADLQHNSTTKKSVQRTQYLMWHWLRRHLSFNNP